MQASFSPLAALILSTSAFAAQAATTPLFNVGARSGFVQDESHAANGHAEISTDLGFFQGSASADLGTGILRASASASTTNTGTCDPSASGSPCIWGSQSRAFLIDTVTLHRTAALPGQTTRIDWQWDIDGHRDNGPFNGQTTAMAYAYVGDSTEAMGAAPGVNLGSFNQIKGTVEFDTEDYTVYVYGFIDLSARNGATADYAHTMKFSWSLPEDVRYTSSSGLFLKGATAVPEPESGALMLAGLGLMGWCLQRRRAQGEAA
ncbi:MAG: PEP-CTERM sorting domain-containing protein [Rubrivivax sp.]|nr:MAG: PEP-CTERM sorting domain-containing protein [Rubrivivax sp.]